MENTGDTYTPKEAECILSRSSKPISERRIRQLLKSGELAGHKDGRGFWHARADEVHRLLEERRDPEAPTVASLPTESAVSAGELLDRVLELQREAGRLESRLELTERAESTVRDERDRLLLELAAERAERRQLQERLEAAIRPDAGPTSSTPTEAPAGPQTATSKPSRPFWRRLLGG